ncbi:hypothetical protein LSAT2_013330, partial [Lamellibrachia satsuma]
VDELQLRMPSMGFQLVTLKKNKAYKTECPFVRTTCHQTPNIPVDDDMWHAWHITGMLRTRQRRTGFSATSAGGMKVVLITKD